jgi:hypothetical protein
MRMAMTNADNCMAAIKVKILIALVVPYLTTFSLNDVNIKKGINIE